MGIASVEGGLGVPTFSGDDRAIVYSQTDNQSPSLFSLVRQALEADGLTPQGDPALWLKDGVAGVLYRRGTFAITPHNFAVTKISAPKRVALSDRRPEKVVKVKVQIQNRSPNDEVIESFAALQGLVHLSVTSVDACSSPLPQLLPPKSFPIVLRPKKKLTLKYLVTFDCANDAAKSTRKDPGHEDFSLSATVTRDALDGVPDTDVEDDTCPRIVAPPFVLVDSIPGLKDKGCGAKRPDKTLGDPILTDVVIK